MVTAILKPDFRFTKLVSLKLNFERALINSKSPEINHYQYLTNAITINREITETIG